MWCVYLVLTVIINRKLQFSPFSAKLHHTDTGYGHAVPPTDELTTILQLVVQQIHHQRTKICHIPTSWHVEMLGSDIAMWHICCTTSCRIVVSLSVGGAVQHVRSRCPCSGVWHLTNSDNIASVFHRLILASLTYLCLRTDMMKLLNLVQQWGALGGML